MLISIEHRFAFLAVPKTGSTSIEAELAPYCDISFRKMPQIKHMTAKRFHRHIRPYLLAMGFESVETCAVIREPIDWLGSWYRYRARPELAGNPNSTQNMSFDSFALAYMQDPKPGFATVGQQSIFLAGPQAAPSIDHLFPFEAMEKLQGFLITRFEKSLNFGNLNQSPVGDLTLSASTRSALEVHFEPDYALWRQACSNHL